MAAPTIRTRQNSLNHDFLEPAKKRARTSFSPSTTRNSTPSSPIIIKGRHREIGLMRNDGEQNASSFVGSSSGIFFIRSVYNALANDATISDVTTPRADIVVGEDDRLPSTSPDATKPANQGIWTHHEKSNVERISFDELRTLSEEYFDHWHQTSPYLFAPAILQCFDKISQQPLAEISRAVDIHELTIIRSIMSISSADRRQCGKRGTKRPVPKQLLFDSYNEAIESVQGFISTPASLKSLQAVLSVQLFLISMLRHNGASRLGGLAVRMAFQLGLHRCPTRYAHFSADEAQMRKRIFWTTYCLDRMLCQSLGLPLGIRDDDVDVCGFDHEKHQDQSIPQYPLDPRLASLHFLIKHAAIKGMIVELCNKNIDQRPASTEQNHIIDEALARFKNEFDAYTEVNPSNVILNNARHAAFLALHAECKIALNRPLLALPRHLPDYVVALQNCIGAARSIINTLHTKLMKHLTTIESPDEKSVLTPLFWPSFTWMVWMSSFIVLFAATHEEVPKDVATRLVEKSIDVLTHLSTRGTVWPSACAAAVGELVAKLDSIPTISRKENNSHHSNEPYADQPTPSTIQGEQFPPNGRASSYHSSQQPSGAYVPITTSYFARINEESDQSMSYCWPKEATSGPDINLFDGFDIPFHLGDDQYSSMLNMLSDMPEIGTWNETPSMPV